MISRTPKYVGAKWFMIWGKPHRLVHAELSTFEEYYDAPMQEITEREAMEYFGLQRRIEEQRPESKLLDAFINLLKPYTTKKHNKP